MLKRAYRSASAPETIVDQQPPRNSVAWTRGNARLTSDLLSFFYIQLTHWIYRFTSFDLLYIARTRHRSSIWPTSFDKDGPLTFITQSRRSVPRTAYRGDVWFHRSSRSASAVRNTHLQNIASSRHRTNVLLGRITNCNHWFKATNAPSDRLHQPSASSVPILRPTTQVRPSCFCQRCSKC
jgi:hypothetical protein